MDFSIGIGITNKCNYNCSHCYSREDQTFELKYEDVEKLCKNLDITAINFGTGESGLHSEFDKITDYVYKKGIKMALTTNGYTVALLDDKQLKRFNDIDFSLDFAQKDNHDQFRGLGAANLVETGIERCKRLGVEASFACAMMKENYNVMDKMAEKARGIGVNLRVNVYKPVHTLKHLLTYDEFWEGVKRLFSNSKIVSCSEPIVNALIRNKTLDGGSRCGKKSLRIRPDGGIVPCVYWNKSMSSIDELVANKKKFSYEAFLQYIEEVTEETKAVPEECADCDVLDICQGGCAARRLYNDMNKPDLYCFRLYGKQPPNIDFEWGESKDLVHSDYLCTIIVQ
ncbi:radical SAM protein|uniref:Radical SAM additional 4Fe4S-binding SPASM domain-containing protein n=1 Tax=Dendrosporobacter quercicolus TaxID=146817 RepID=A0A1G9VW34_9FIRM|nr:radical SAM protein [Dendrosporobacter quercicolus]NSL47783.1 radical SAM protein [Dendrosporobacter quercicolus DSM 1736]SDM76478.1 radical SAM additional 4Fe4S-binding SPASM domain-containing protein [Dendrosporobacter quercicolus]